MAFRDHKDALRERFDGLAHDIAALRASVTEAFFRVLPPEASRDLDAAARTMDRLGASPSNEGMAAREAYLERLRHWVDRIPELDERGRILPAEAPLPALFAHGPDLLRDRVFGRARRRARALLRALRSVAPEARVERRTGRVRAWFHVEGVPFAFAAGLAEHDDEGGAMYALATSTCPLVGWLEVVPQSLAADALANAAPELWHPLGDPRVDPRFRIRAHQPARTLLTEPVRAALATLPSSTTLMVEPGTASFRWRGEVTADVVRTAVQALRSIREAPPALTLRA